MQLYFAVSLRQRLREMPARIQESLRKGIGVQGKGIHETLFDSVS